MPDMQDDQADPQDRAETLDETNLTEDGQEIANFDEIEDVYDATQKRGDADDEQALALDAADYDPDDLDEEAIEEDDFDPDIAVKSAVGRRVGGFDEDRPGRDTVAGQRQVGDADAVEGGEDDFTDFQSRRLSDDDLTNLGYAEDRRAHEAHPGPEDVEDNRDPKTEKRRDRTVEDTFPASDPPPTSPGAD